MNVEYPFPPRDTEPWERELERRQISAANQPATDVRTNGLRTRTWGEVVAAADADPPRQVVEGHAAEGDVVMVFGYSGLGKSGYVLDMSVSIQRGEKFLGRFATLKANVGVIDEESHLQRLGGRLRQVGRGRAIDPEDGELPVFSVGDGARLDTDDGLGCVFDFVARNDLWVLAIDTMRRVHRLRENEADDMAKIELAIKTLQRRVWLQLGHPLTVILIHHSPKPRAEAPNAAETMARGSGDIYAGVDVALYLRRGREAGQVVVEQPKNRWGAAQPAYLIRIEGDDDELRLTYGGNLEEMAGEQARAEELALAVLGEGAGPRTKEELVDRGKAAQLKKRTVERALDALVARGEVMKGSLGRKRTYNLTEAGLLR
jgi:hypothetical protein